MKKNLLMIFCFFTITSTFAGGFRVSLQGVRQAALGATGVSLAEDASVAFYNPAGLAMLDSKFSVAAGAFGVTVESKYQNTNTFDTAESDNTLGTPLYLAASYKPTNNLAVALSVTTPFGSALNWGDDWVGRYTIQNIELKAIFIQPTIAYAFTDWFSVGAGYIFAKGSVHLEKAIAVAGTDVSLAIDDTKASGSGYNVGVYIKPSDKVNIGVSYRSRVDMEVEDGDVIVENAPTLVENLLPFNATSFGAKLPLAAEALFGLSYQATPKLLLVGEVAAVNWEEYRALKLEFFDGNGGEYISESERNYNNTMNYSLGVEYAVTETIDARLGYKYDQSPSPAEYYSSETPTVDYHAFTAGLGFGYKSFQVDLFGEYVKGEERTFNNVNDNFGGDIMTNAVVFGAGLSYKFGNAPAL